MMCKAKRHDREVLGFRGADCSLSLAKQMHVAL